MSMPVKSKAISLGLSCQTRFTIDAVCSDYRRFPFDYNITTKHGLLQALSSEGQSLFHSQDEISIYSMRDSGERGISARDVYFWHDYPRLEDDSLADGWERHVDEVNAKYRYLWPRFSALCRDEGIEKDFFVSNTQDNLIEFAASEADFEGKFGLDVDFYQQLVRHLETLGCSNYRVTFLNRNLGQALRTRAKIEDPRFSTRFLGVCPLPANIRLSFSAMGAQWKTSGAPIDELGGQYMHGQTVFQIEAAGADVATAYEVRGEHRHACAEISSIREGYLAVFEGHERIYPAVLDGSTLRFASDDLFLSKSFSWTKL